MTDRRLGSSGYLNSTVGTGRVNYDTKYIDIRAVYSKPTSGIKREESTRVSRDNYISNARDRSIGGDSRATANRDLKGDTSRGKLQNAGYKSSNPANHISVAANKSRISRTLMHYEASKTKTGEMPTHYQTLWKERSKEVTNTNIPTFVETKDKNTAEEVKRSVDGEQKSVRPVMPSFGNLSAFNRPERVSENYLSSYKTLRQQNEPIRSSPYLEINLHQKDDLQDLKLRNNPALAKADLVRSIEDVALKTITRRESVTDLMDIMRRTNFNETLVRELVEKLVHYKSSYEGVKATCSRLLSKKTSMKEITEIIPSISSHAIKLDMNPQLAKKTIEIRAIPPFSKEIKPILENSPGPKIEGDLKEHFATSSVKSENGGNNMREDSDDTIKAKEGNFNRKLTKSFAEEDDKKTKVRNREDLLLADIGTPKR